MDRRSDTQTETARKKGVLPDEQTERRIVRQTCRQRDRQVDRRTDRQTNRKKIYTGYDITKSHIKSVYLRRGIKYFNESYQLAKYI